MYNKHDFHGSGLRACEIDRIKIVVYQMETENEWCRIRLKRGLLLHDR